MIWVIGDIHGMFDPLKRLLTDIQGFSARKEAKERIEKVIFLGDYIDHGPSSKEIVDYIMGLPFETVCLMGNHEDLMLQFLNNSDLFKSFGNVWFRGNGGQKTVSSFFPHVLFRNHEEDIKQEEFPLEDKYLQFFNKLQYSHTERIGGVPFVFVHAMPNSEFSLQDQLGIENFEAFHRWCKENKVWIEDTLIWNRQMPLKKIEDFVFVHGHTPTNKLSPTRAEKQGYDPDSCTPFFNFELGEDETLKHYDRSYEMTFMTSLNKLISINIDTGAVYGDRLTALGLSESMIEKNEFAVHQISIKEGYRNSTEYHTMQVKLDQW
jgi:serine/threonine protein phosphatase 1